MYSFHCKKTANGLNKLGGEAWMESDQTVPQNLKVIGEGIFFFNKLSKFSFL